jgi:NADH-quinone oxidoreductase subunit L
VGALLEKPEALAFDAVPFWTSIGVALGGILLGWLVYRNAYATVDAKDPLENPLGGLYRWLKNKYYIDELYDSLFVQPTFALAKYVFPAIDRGIIDGILHLIGNVSLGIGNVVKDYIDVPVVNGTNDKSGEAVKDFGGWIRIIQTGRVQEYLLMTMTMLVLIVAFVFWLVR